MAEESLLDQRENQKENKFGFSQNWDLKEAIKNLDKKYRDVLVLKYVYGYSIKEIAEMLSITETNVSTRLDRGRKQLKQIL